MGKLFELLAVEKALDAQAHAELAQALHDLASGDAYVGQVRKYSPLVEGDETFPPEQKNIRLKAMNVLRRFAATFGEYMDVVVQKELTNSTTRADVVTEHGQTILVNMSAPALLNLESRLEEIRRVIEAVPTLDPTEAWMFSQDEGVWVTQVRTVYRTKKIPRAFTKAEATKEHPAQVEVYYEDVRAGSWEAVLKCSCISIEAKRTILDRLAELSRAVKQARQRANDVDHIVVNPSKSIFDYLFGGME